MRTKDVTRLHSDHLQPSAVPLGPQSGGLVPCATSKHHPAHPSEEDCSWCPPPKPGLGEPFVRHMREMSIIAYGADNEYLPKPWAEMTRAERKRWDDDAETAVKIHDRFHPGTYPVWHPLRLSGCLALDP